MSATLGGGLGERVAALLGRPPAPRAAAGQRGPGVPRAPPSTWARQVRRSPLQHAMLWNPPGMPDSEGVLPLESFDRRLMGMCFTGACACPGSPSPQRASAASADCVMNNVAGYMRLCQHMSATPNSRGCHMPLMPTLALDQARNGTSLSVQLPD